MSKEQTIFKQATNAMNRNRNATFADIWEKNKSRTITQTLILKVQYGKVKEYF